MLATAATMIVGKGLVHNPDMSALHKAVNAPLTSVQLTTKTNIVWKSVLIT